MGGVIYLMRQNGALIEMNERGYDTEDLLQWYLADHPDLLAGAQINEDEPRRWLLISREMGVPFEEGGSDRWSADHLFLDQDAIPTIVEVKRSSDTRARREVVAQMLDYAANGVMYRPLERLRSTFEANCEAQSHEPEAKPLGSLGLELDPEDFWQRATTNLQAGKVRLIFVVDKIPAELRRIVEFLNKQMNPAEVLAVEIKQHVAEGQEEKAFVPRLIGRTADAERIKLGGTQSSRQWDETSFFEELEAKAPEAVKPARAILKWAENRVNRVAWGKGLKYGTFNAMLDHQGSAHRLLEVWTDGYLHIQLGDPQAYILLVEEPKRSELLLRLEEVPGISISDQASKKWATILLTLLNGEAALAKFLKVLRWYVEEVKAT